jgi:Outer membrane protein
MKQFFVFFFIVIFFASQSFSQEVAIPSYSLNDCIDIALNKNPGLLASKQQVQKSYFQIGEARSGYFPEIDLSLGYQRSYQESRIGNEYSKNYSGQLSLTQTIFDFGRTSKKVDIQRELFKATEWQDRDTILGIIYNVKDAYFNLLKAKKQRETAQEVMKQAQKHLDLAKVFMK